MFVRYVKMDMKRAFCSYRFLFSVLLIVVLLHINIYSTEGTSIVNRISYMTIESSMLFVVFAIASFPYGASMCEDCADRYDMELVFRGDKQSYVLSKVLVSFTSAFLTMFTAFLIYIVTYGNSHGFMYDNYSNDIIMFRSQYHGAYMYLLESNQLAKYFIMICIYVGFFAGVLSVTGLVVSVWVKSKLIVYMSPVIMQYVLQFVTVRINNNLSKYSLYERGYYSISYITDMTEVWMYIIGMCWIMASFIILQFAYKVGEH